MTTSIVDLSHWNTVLDWTKVKGIRGVFHKATQGEVYVDPQYHKREPLARAQGLLWGAYHFGTGGYVEAQVNHFLSQVNPKTTRLALDLEGNPGGPSMPLPDAEAWVSLIHNRTGRWPVLYTGLWYIEGVCKIGSGKTVLSNCPLWLASYTPRMPALPIQWSSAVLWQYTNGKSGNQPRTIQGIGGCDIDLFNDNYGMTIEEFWG